MEINAMKTGPELVCSDCGVRFRARRVTDGVEEICDACYDLRFPAREPRAVSRHSRRSIAAD